jgi:hypothetical protein
MYIKKLEQAMGKRSALLQPDSELQRYSFQVQVPGRGRAAVDSDSDSALSRRGPTPLALRLRRVRCACTWPPSHTSESRVKRPQWAWASLATSGPGLSHCRCQCHGRSVCHSSWHGASLPVAPGGPTRSRSLAEDSAGMALGASLAGSGVVGLRSSDVVRLRLPS